MLKNSLKKNIATIKKNRFKIILLLFLQIIFFISLTIVFTTTINPAMEHAKTAVDYYDKINITEDSGMFGYLGKEPLVVYQSYNSMIYYLRFMGIFAFLSFVIINGMLWTLTDNLINKKNIKQSLDYFTKFGIITLAFILIFYILIFTILKSSLADLEYSLLPLIGALLLFIALVYFVLISFSIIHKRNLKEIAKLTFKLGIKKFPKIILIYLINLFIILLISYLLYLTIEANIILLSIILILLILSFVFTRLFLIVSINYLIKKN